MDRSSQYGPWSEGLHMNRLVILPASTCTRKLCMEGCLCRNGSTVTMNNKVGQSLAVARLDPQLLHSSLLTLIASPLSTVSSSLQKTNPTKWDAVMTIAEMGD